MVKTSLETLIRDTLCNLVFIARESSVSQSPMSVTPARLLLLLLLCHSALAWLPPPSNKPRHRIRIVQPTSPIVVPARKPSSLIWWLRRSIRKIFESLTVSRRYYTVTHKTNSQWMDEEPSWKQQGSRYLRHCLTTICSLRDKNIKWK